MRPLPFISAGSVAGALTAVAILWPAGAGAAASCGPVGAVPTPSRGSFDGLYGVSAVSSSDVWAAGRYVNANSADKTLVENWDGTRFRQVTSPDPQPNDVLFGVGAVSATDVWAVGETWPATAEVDSPLAEHFDGRTWTVVPLPALPSGSGLLRGVAASSADDVWAVGSELSGPADSNAATLTEHWDGTAWHVMSSPDPGRYGNYLDSVTVVSPRDVWAVGTAEPTAHGTATLVEHWDGSRWSVMPSPDAGIQDSLESVAAVSAADVWAAGDYFTGTGGGSRVLTLALHFNGKKWSQVASPSPYAHNNLFAITAVSSRDVWAVGGSDSGAAGLVEHWNGARWQVAAEPYRRGGANFLYAVSGGAGPGVWAAGSLSGNQTLALHFCEA